MARYYGLLSLWKIVDYLDKYFNHFWNLWKGFMAYYPDE